MVTMARLPLIAVLAACGALAGCGQGQGGARGGPSALHEPIRVELDLQDPSKSFGVLSRGQAPQIFWVGFGRHGVTCAGKRFEEGYTPLGRFRVNAILSDRKFVMEPQLIAQSGKSEQELRSSLFKTMNAIDFDGDGQIGEYGLGYISLAPIGGVKQPFRFNTYNGRFRWYSFAIHGSNNDKRVGHQVTGGCLNVTAPVLRTLLGAVKLGDEVEVRATGPCTP